MVEVKGAFQNWRKKVDKKVSTLSSKTSLAVDRSKVRKQIGVLEDEIKFLKQEIGEIVNMNRNNLFSITMVNYQLTQIETKEKAIARLELEIEELSERGKLAGVEEAVVRESDEKISLVEEVNQDILSTQTYCCSNCNEHYDEPKMFCEKCGNSMG